MYKISKSESIDSGRGNNDNAGIIGFETENEGFGNKGDKGLKMLRAHKRLPESEGKFNTGKSVVEVIEKVGKRIGGKRIGDKRIGGGKRIGGHIFQKKRAGWRLQEE